MLDYEVTSVGLLILIIAILLSRLLISLIILVIVDQPCL